MHKKPTGVHHGNEVANHKLLPDAHIGVVHLPYDNMMDLMMMVAFL